MSCFGDITVLQKLHRVWLSKRGSKELPFAVMVELDRISGLSQTSNYIRMNLRGELKTRTGLGTGSHITLRLDNVIPTVIQTVLKVP